MKLTVMGSCSAWRMAAASPGWSLSWALGLLQTFPHTPPRQKCPPLGGLGPTTQKEQNYQPTNQAQPVKNLHHQQAGPGCRAANWDFVLLGAGRGPRGGVGGPVRHIYIL